MPLRTVWLPIGRRGDLARDATGNGHDARISGATWVKLSEGFALEFDGTDDVLECADADDLNLTETLSVEAWVTHRGFPRSNTSILRKGNGYSLELGHDGTFLFTDRCRTPPLLLPDFWHHMVGVFEGETVAFYHAGELVNADKPSRKGPLPDSKGSVRDPRFARRLLHLPGHARRGAHLQPAAFPR